MCALHISIAPHLYWTFLKDQLGMKNLKKIFLIAPPLMVAMFLFLVLVEAPSFYPAESSVEEKALSVMTDVIGLDLKKYNVELYSNSSETPEDLGGLVQEHVAYTLEFAGSKILVIFTFLDGTLIHWSLGQFDALPLSPLYVQPLPTNTLDVVKDALQRYQAYSKAAIVQEARNVLDTVTELKTMNATVGNLKMQVTEGNSFTNIDWVRTINGLEFPTGLSIRLTNGVIDTFTDQSRFFKIGSSDVNISREEAVRIAWEEAKTFTTVDIWLGNGYGTFPFRVKEEPWIVRLQVGTANFTSYPYWYVWFVADPEVHCVTGVEVYLRADTGEIAYSRTT